METFKDIKGFEGIYQVSNIGNVKSLDRLDSAGHRLKERILKPLLANTGYHTLSLFKNGNPISKQVHQLVAIAFLKHTPCRHRLVVNHIDFNKTNNNINNLEIVTNRENCNQKHLKSSSKYTGVGWAKEKSKWKSAIRINNKATHLGYFIDELQASKMYQLALRHLDKYKGNNKEFREFLLSL